jgi:integrase
MKSISWVRFSEEILELYEPPIRSKGTWYKIRQVLQVLSKVGVKSPRDLTPRTVNRFVRELEPGRSPATVAGLLAYLKITCGYAIFKKYTDSNPFDFRADWIRADPVDPDGPSPPGRSHSAEEIRTLFELLDVEAAGGGWKEARLQSLVYTLAFLGLRKMEALQLQLGDLSLDNRTVAIRSRRRHRGKTRASRAELVMPADLHQVLATWLPRTGSLWVFPGVTGKGPWTGGMVGHRPLDCVKAAGRRAGIANLTILDFRHTLATLADSMGMGELELMSWLRHTNPRTMGWYRKKTDLSSKRSTAEKITFKTVS